MAKRPITLSVWCATKKSGLRPKKFVEIKLKELNAEFRVDSEYHKKTFLNEDCQRREYENLELREIAFITDGQHGYHEVDESSSIFLLTAKNAKNRFADREGADRVAQWVDDNNKRSSLVKNDLIISTRGSVGYSALVTDDVLPANIDQDVARVAIQDSRILPEFLLTYLNSNFGQDWMRRNSTGMVQQGLSLAKLRELPVPNPSDNFQSQIQTLIKSAQQKREQSKPCMPKPKICCWMNWACTTGNPPPNKSPSNLSSKVFSKQAGWTRNIIRQNIKRCWRC